MNSQPAALPVTAISPVDAPATIDTTGQPERLNRKIIGLLSLSHASVDLNPSALAALLPFFYVAFHLTYTTAALLTATSQITSSISQLAFGYVSDRTSLRWLIPLGCMLSGLGLALTSLAPNYPLLLVAISISGLGIAAFHPEAARSANRFAGQNRATGMSIFSVGGNAGFAGGPLAVALLGASVLHGGTLLFLVPSLLVTAAIWLPLRAMPSGRAAARAGQGVALLHPRVGLAVVVLTLVTILRSIVQVTLLTFVPLYEVTALGRPQAVASSLLTTFLAAGAAGTLLSGVAADRWGRKRVVIISFFAGAPLLWLFMHSDGLLSYVALGGVGLALLSTFAVTIVMAQELLPHRAGMAAALVIGFASGVGGAAVGLLGRVADTFGPGVVLSLLAVFPLLAALLSCWLIEPGRGEG